MALVDIQLWAAIFAKKRSRLTSAKMYKFLQLPATVKLSVLLAVKLRHITVVESPHEHPGCSHLQSGSEVGIQRSATNTDECSSKWTSIQDKCH